jgi:hypothetical protein
MANALSLGFSTHVLKYGASAGSYVQRLAATGVDTIRDDLSWSTLQPGGRGSALVTGPVNTLCGLCRTNNLKLIPIVGYSPAWANGGRDDKTGPVLAADFGDYVATLVTFLQANWSDVVIAIEYWNEPDIGFLKNPATGAQGDAAYYASLAADAYGKKPGGTTIKYWGGASSGAAPDWAWNVITAMGGVGSLDFDEWSFHAYPAYNRALGTPTKTAEQMLDTTVASAWSEAFWRPQTHGTLLDVLNHFGYGGQIHNTEAGVPTLPPSGADVVDCHPEAQQRRWLELLWPIWTAQPRTGLFMIYTGQDDDTNTSASPPGREAHFGGFHTDTTAKPIIASLQALTAGGVTAYSNVVGPIVALIGTAYSNVVGPVVAADTTAPTVSLTAPANGAAVSGPVTISATAADNVAVAQVDFLVDGIVVATDVSSPYSVSWNSALASNGSHTITARATDTSGNVTTSAARTVTVSGGIATATHLAEPFPTLLFDIDFPDNILAIPYAAQVLSTTGDQAQHPLPLGYYRHQAASGTVAAEAQGKTAGTYGGTISAYHVASPVAADDYAVTLGSSGVFYAGVPYSSNAGDITPYGITMCGWFKAGTIPGGVPWVGLFTRATAVELFLSPGGLLSIGAADNNPQRGTTAIAAGEWFFAALTISGTAPPDDPNQDPTGFASVYLMKLSDLVLRKEVTAGQRFSDQWAGAAPTTVGYNAGGLSIDETAYWVGQLTPQQLSDIAGRANPSSFVYPNYVWTAMDGGTVSSPVPRLAQGLSTARGRQTEREQPTAGQVSATVEDTLRALEPDYPASPYYPNVINNRYARLRATVSPTTYDLMRFFIPDWNPGWTLRRAYLTLAGTDLLGVLGTWPLSGSFQQQQTGARINAVLDRVGWPTAARAIDAGTQTVAAETVVGGGTLTYLQLIAQSDNGLFFIDAAGNAVFHDSAHRTTATRSTVPQAVFGDGGPSTTELPYVSVAYNKPADEIWNQVTVKYGAAGDQSVTVSDYVSQRRGVKVLPDRETRLVTAAAATSLATLILARYKDPAARFTQVVIEPARYPGLWAKALGLEISDRVIMKARRPGGGAAISKDCWIEAVGHQISFDPNKWVTTLALTTV